MCGRVAAIVATGDGCADCGAPSSHPSSNATVFVAVVPQASRRPVALPSSRTVFLDGVGPSPVWRRLVAEGVVCGVVFGQRLCPPRGQEIASVSLCASLLPCREPRGPSVSRCRPCETASA